MKLIQPGEQEVIIGSVPPVLRRWRSSLPSSIIVRSAVKSVSNTLSKPRRLRPATIFLVTRLPAGIPNSSPIAARTAGAVCTTTNLSGSLIASQTRSIWLFSRSAPTGQMLIHCPQATQATSPRFFLAAGATTVSKPRSTGNSWPTLWTSRQTVTHLRQRMHLLESRTTLGELVSTRVGGISPSNLFWSMPRRFARA